MRECKECKITFDESNFWSGRRICKKCYHEKHQVKTCPSCGNRLSIKTKHCNMCKYKDGKKCNKCDKVLSITDFGHKIRENGSIAARSNCKSCEVSRTKQYKTNNPEKVRKAKTEWAKKNPDSVKKSTIKRKLKRHDIQDKDINSLIDYVYTKKTCDICNKDITGKRNKHIDHCHSTNNFRGVLCQNCNLALGLVQDNINVLRSMICYLENRNWK